MPWGFCWSNMFTADIWYFKNSCWKFTFVYMEKHICIWIWLLEKHISILDISRLTWFFTWFFSAARDLRFCAGNKPADSRSTMSWGMMTAVLVNYLELKSFECAQPLLVDDYGGLYYPNLPNIEWGLSCSFNTPCPPEIESSTQSR